MVYAGLVATASGCADGRPALYPVSGTVAFPDGTPVRNASIEFTPTTQSPSPRGRVDAQGRFTLGTYESDDGAPAGTYRVVVTQPLPPNAAANVMELGDEHASHAGGIRVVALRHASPSTSGVTAEVAAADSNELAIVVESR